MTLAVKMTAEDVQRLRRMLGLTQVGLAAIIPSTQRTISRWERGQVRPSPLYVRRLREIEADAQGAKDLLRTG